jgi:hypothetical protein
MKLLFIGDNGGADGNRTHLKYGSMAAKSYASTRPVIVVIVVVERMGIKPT